MSDVQFRAADHTYWIGDQELPGVTRILDVGGACVDHFGFTDESRARGTYVHRATQAIDTGERLTEVPYLYEPFVTAYRCFVRDMEPTWSRSEAIVADEAQRYAGTLDRAGLVRDAGKMTPYLIDIKTGEAPPSVGPQTAAYARCLPDPLRWHRACLQLLPTGRYRWLPLTDRADLTVFFAALTLYDWKVRYQVNGAARKGAA